MRFIADDPTQPKRPMNKKSFDEMAGILALAPEAPLWAGRLQDAWLESNTLRRKVAPTEIDLEFEKFLDAQAALGEAPTAEQLNSFIRQYSYRKYRLIGNPGYDDGHGSDKLLYHYVHPYSQQACCDVILGITAEEKVVTTLMATTEVMTLDLGPSTPAVAAAKSPRFAGATYWATYITEDGELAVVTGPDEGKRFVELPTIIKAESAENYFNHLRGHSTGIACNHPDFSTMMRKAVLGG